MKKIKEKGKGNGCQCAQPTIEGCGAQAKGDEEKKKKDQKKKGAKGKEQNNKPSRGLMTMAEPNERITTEPRGEA